MALRFRWLLLPVVAVALVLLLSVTPVRTEAQSETNQDNPQAEEVVSSEPVLSARSAEEVEEYWTPQRMRKAKPADGSVPEGPESASSESPPVPQGEAGEMPPAPPDGDGSSVSTVSSAEIQPQAQSSDGYTYPFPFTRYEVFADYQEFPYSTNGRIFYTKNGKNFTCSGTVLNSANKSVVWTAGHCVHRGRGGAFHTNWAFVPAYKDGERPFGTWSAHSLFALKGWTDKSSPRHDLGAAVINPGNDFSDDNIANVVGGMGIRWNRSPVQHFHAFGYPKASPFNGQRLQLCTASYATSDTPGSVAGPATIGIGCDVTGGASGGGWIMDFSGSGGWVNSVHKYSKSSQPLAEYGPYHGNGAKNLFNTVRDFDTSGD